MYCTVLYIVLQWHNQRNCHARSVIQLLQWCIAWPACHFVSTTRYFVDDSICPLPKDTWAPLRQLQYRYAALWFHCFRIIVYFYGSTCCFKRMEYTICIWRVPSACFHTLFKLRIRDMRIGTRYPFHQCCLRPSCAEFAFCNKEWHVNAIRASRKTPSYCISSHFHTLQGAFSTLPHHHHHHPLLISYLTTISCQRLEHLQYKVIRALCHRIESNQINVTQYTV